MQLSGSQGGFRPRANPELVEDVANVNLHGDGTDEERFADSGVRKSPCDQS
jgi:hypothetical protein